MFKKLVLTGAAGRLGSYLREPLSKLCEELVSTDWQGDVSKTLPNERFVQADLADLAQMEALLEGADQVIHFGAIGDESTWDAILHSNLIGSYNIWEAAKTQGVKRVVYASSIHAIGMHKKNDLIGVDAAHRPDSYYGLAKCFAEDLARMYWDKFSIEAACLRIYSAAEPNGARSLHAWLSYRDLEQLVVKSVTAPITEFAIIWGVSNNDRCPFDTSTHRVIGYAPVDNAETYADELLAKEPPHDPTDLARTTIGGPFAVITPGQSGLATMNVKDKKKEV